MEWKSSIFQVHCHSAFFQRLANEYQKPLPLQSDRLLGAPTSTCRGNASSENSQAHQETM